jgi:hypothetical protein
MPSLLPSAPALCATGVTTMLVYHHMTLQNTGMLLLTAEPAFHACCYHLPFRSLNLENNKTIQTCIGTMQ